MVRNEKNNTINWSEHEMMVLITSACGEGSDEPACTHDLARAFAFSHKQCVQVQDDSKQLRSGHARISDY